MGKKRLDILLAEKGLAESRSLAQRLIMAGQVRVDDQVAMKPSDQVDEGSRLTIESGPRFVSRGGEKLDAALTAFGLTPLNGCVCADIGASTGGFTDCLLKSGAGRVYAVDVGYGELHWKLRNDPRVVVMERSNARFLEGFPEPIDLVTIDASFISLRVLLPVVRMWFAAGRGKVVALIKPQFEAGRQIVARGEGVVRDPQVHRNVIEDLFNFIEAQGYQINGLIRSPLLGPKGNTEFLVYIEYPASGMGSNSVGLIEALFQSTRNE